VQVPWTHNGGAEIRQNVAEQIGSDDHIEPIDGQQPELKITPEFLNGGAEIRQNVAEQIGSDDHIEPIDGQQPELKITPELLLFTSRYSMSNFPREQSFGRGPVQLPAPNSRRCSRSLDEMARVMSSCTARTSESLRSY